MAGIVDRALSATARMARTRATTRPPAAIGRRGLSQGLIDVEPFLRPGDWSLVYRPTRVLHRPIPLALVRSGAAVPAHIDGPAFIAIGSTDERSHLYRALVIDWTVHDSMFQADVLLFRHSGKRLLFDLERSEVLRWVAEPITEEYEALRRTFSRHVPSVPFEVNPSRRSLREPLVVGEMLGELPPERMEFHCRALLRGLAELIENEARSDIDAASVPIRYAAERSPIDDARSGAEDLAEMFGEDAPVTIPVHGDLAASNVLVDDGAPVAIDFGPMERGPFFSDVLGVADHLPDLWVDGGFDEELGTVWEAAGLRPVRWNRENVRLAMLARAVERADRRIRNTRPPLEPVKRRVKAADMRVQWRDQVLRLP